MSSEEPHRLLDPKYKTLGILLYNSMYDNFVEKEQNTVKKFANERFSDIMFTFYAEYIDTNEAIIDEFEEAYNNHDVKKITDILYNIDKTVKDHSLMVLIYVKSDPDEFRKKYSVELDPVPQRHELVNYIRENYKIKNPEELNKLYEFYIRNVNQKWNTEVQYIESNEDTQFILIGAFGI